MKYKIIGTAAACIGILLIIKYNHHFIGLVLIFSGIILAMIKGMKPE
jgi:hypothetical protein